MILRYVDIVETSHRLKVLCVAKGYSAGDIQKRLKLQSVQSVYAWWSSQSKNLPGIDHLVQLSDLLGCTMEDMLVLKEVEIAIHAFDCFGGDSLRFVPGSDNDDEKKTFRQRIAEIVHEAEVKSASTCEFCGKQGTLRRDLLWIKTLCEDCYAKMRKKL